MKQFDILQQARVVAEVLRDDYQIPFYASDLIECMLRGSAQEMEKVGIEVLAMYIVQGGHEVVIQTHAKKLRIKVPRI